MLGFDARWVRYGNWVSLVMTVAGPLFFWQGFVFVLSRFQWWGSFSCVELVRTAIDHESSLGIVGLR